jgi:hypothetical protein
LTGKIKLTLALAVLGFIITSLAVCHFERRENKQLKIQLAELSSQLHLAETREKLICADAAKKQARKPKPPKRRATSRAFSEDRDHKLNGQNSIPQMNNIEVNLRPKRLKNRLLLGFEPDQAKIEYAYVPLGVRTRNFELGLCIYADLFLNYSFTPESASAGIGIETRF